MQNRRSADACLGADDFLPLFVWVLVQCNVLTAELEAEYMWGLLHPSLIPGEGGYYLTALCGAVHVLKSYKSSMEAGTANGVKTLGSDNNAVRTILRRPRTFHAPSPHYSFVSRGVVFCRRPSCNEIFDSRLCS